MNNSVIFLVRPKIQNISSFYTLSCSQNGIVLKGFFNVIPMVSSGRAENAALIRGSSTEPIDSSMDVMILLVASMYYSTQICDEWAALVTSNSPYSTPARRPANNSAVFLRWRDRGQMSPFVNSHIDSVAARESQTFIKLFINCAQNIYTCQMRFPSRCCAMCSSGPLNKEATLQPINVKTSSGVPPPSSGTMHLGHPSLVGVPKCICLMLFKACLGQFSHLSPSPL